MSSACDLTRAGRRADGTKTPIRCAICIVIGKKQDLAQERVFGLRIGMLHATKEVRSRIGDQSAHQLEADYTPEPRSRMRLSGTSHLGIDYGWGDNNQTRASSSVVDTLACKPRFVATVRPKCCGSIMSGLATTASLNPGLAAAAHCSAIQKRSSVLIGPSSVNPVKLIKSRMIPCSPAT